jgi:hypothetical protein
MSLRSRVGPLDRAAITQLTIGSLLVGAAFAALTFVTPLPGLPARTLISVAVGIAGGCFFVLSSLMKWADFGGLAAVRETRQALRSGSLPPGADSAVWGPRLSFWGLLLFMTVLYGFLTAMQAADGDAASAERNGVSTAIFAVVTLWAGWRARVERPAAVALSCRLLGPDGTTA